MNATALCCLAACKLEALMPTCVSVDKIQRTESDNLTPPDNNDEDDAVADVMANTTRQGR